VVAGFFQSKTTFGNNARETTAIPAILSLCFRKIKAG
jgi:hypothetical protein